MSFGNRSGPREPLSPRSLQRGLYLRRSVAALADGDIQGSVPVPVFHVELRAGGEQCLDGGDTALAGDQPAASKSAMPTMSPSFAASCRGPATAGAASVRTAAKGRRAEAFMAWCPGVGFALGHGLPSPRGAGQGPVRRGSRGHRKSVIGMLRNPQSSRLQRSSDGLDSSDDGASTSLPVAQFQHEGAGRTKAWIYGTFPDTASTWLIA